MKFIIKLAYTEQYQAFQALADKLGIKLTEVDADRSPGECTIFLTLVRERASEGTIWSDDIYFRVSPELINWLNILPESDKRKQCKTILVSRIQKWLATADGWAAINEACQDFNWGDWLMCGMPFEEYGISMRAPSEIPDLRVTLCVDQDETLIPIDVSAMWRASKNREIVFSKNVLVDFTNGDIIGEIPEEYQSGYDCSVVVDGTQESIPCDPAFDNLRLKEVC